MMTLFSAAETIPFGVAMAVMLGLAILEIVGFLIAISPSEWVDHMVFPDLHVDGGADGVLGWLHIGKVPTLILLMLFLTCFAITGYAVQMLSQSLQHAYLPAVVAVAPALLGAVVSVHLFGGWISRIIPRDESSAISESEFIGKLVTVTSASSLHGIASQARFRDTDGRAYFMLVEPEQEGFNLQDGMQVLVVQKVGSVYRVTANPHVE
jgi:hypothetical protein